MVKIAEGTGSRIVECKNVFGCSKDIRKLGFGVFSLRDV